MLDRCSNPGFRARVGVAAAKSRRLVRAHAAQPLGSEAPPSTGARASARRDHDRSARRGARVQISAIKTDLARLSNDRCIARTRARVLTCAGRAVMRPPPPPPPDRDAARAAPAACTCRRVIVCTSRPRTCPPPHCACVHVPLPGGSCPRAGDPYCFFFFGPYRCTCRLIDRLVIFTRELAGGTRHISSSSGSTYET